MDKSLWFFYGFLFLCALYFFIKYLRSKDKFYGLTFIPIAIISVYISSFFFYLSTGWWMLLVFTIMQVIHLFLAFACDIIKFLLAKKYFNLVANKIHTTDTQHLTDILIDKQNKRQWYVFYLPLDGVIEIGINLSGMVPVQGKRFYILTLTGRIMSLLVGYRTVPINTENNIISPFSEFYETSQQTRTLVNNYIDGIKGNIENPWVISNNADIN